MSTVAGASRPLRESPRLIGGVFLSAACPVAPWPFAVSRYFCWLLVGLSGMVISMTPPTSAGIKYASRN